jgi:hypothetical protein
MDENWTVGDLVGLDNDGDGIYDTNDPDCGTCGNGVLDTGEDCDPSIPGTECCESDCTYSLVGADCSDGEYCNGNETCNDMGICLTGTSVDCSDGIGCTDDSCDEVNDVCVNDPNDTSCDDGVGCTVDTCDPVSDCVFTPEDAGCYPDCENMGDVDVYIKDESRGCFGDDPEMECCLEVCDVVLGDENVSDAILQPIDGSDPPAVACICCPKV